MKFLRKIGMRGCLVALIALFVCTGMWGCGWDEDSEEFSSLRLIGYSYDSLVVYVEKKYEETCLQKPLGADCSTREKGTRITVGNFYTGENIWESDKIKDQGIIHVYDLIDDTTVIEFDKSNSCFYKWTLGKGYESLDCFEWTGCNTSENVESVRSWGDNKLRLVGNSADCAYAIADVKKKTITGYKKLDDFAEGCSDLWDHEGVKYCVGIFKKDTILSYYERYQDGIFFKNERNVKDSLWTYEIFDNVQAMDPVLIFMNSYVMLNIGTLNQNLLKIDFEKVKLVYWRKIR